MIMDAAPADIERGASSDANSVEPVNVSERPSLSDITTRALEVADQRQADRAAGKDVPAELPRILDVPREKDGRFTTKPPVRSAAPKPASPAAEPAPSTTQPDTSSSDPAPAAPAVQPPARWSEAKKADFVRLEPNAQKLVLQHTSEQDADYTRKTQELSEQTKAAEPFIAAYSQHADFLNAQSGKVGLPPHQIMGNMVRVLQQGTTGQQHERMQAAGYVLQLFGIDPRPLLAGQVSQQRHALDPVTHEIASLREQQAEHARFIREAQQERQDQTFATAQQQIDTRSPQPKTRAASSSILTSRRCAALWHLTSRRDGRSTRPIRSRRSRLRMPSRRRCR